MSVKQSAIITKIEDGKLHISICRPEACGACKAQSACSSMGGGKEIVLLDDGLGRKVGDEVTLRMRQTQGLLAVVLAYLMPVALIIGLLLGLQGLGVAEVTSGLITLGVIVVYFIILRLLRKKIETELTIEIE